MSIESDLKKDGITVISELDKISVNTIAKNVSQKIALAFPNLGFNSDELYNRFSNLPMYIANIPEGLSEASYFFKNSAIYFRDGMGLADLEKYAVHELIHNLQEQKDEKGNLKRLGLCVFHGSKATGMGLNEAAVQLISSNILGETFENVTYYDIKFSTISPNCYPLLCNLVSQMAYITGEEVLFDSTFNSNDHFKNKFSALCGENTYKQLSASFDNILNIEEKIIKIRTKLENSDLSIEKSHSMSEKIEELKNQIRTTYFTAQETIIKTYFSTVFKSLLNSEDIDRFRKKLYNFKDLIGTTDSYHFFNDFYISMMENLDKKFDSLPEIENNTYLIERKENKFLKLINYIKKILLKREFENDK